MGGEAVAFNDGPRDAAHLPAKVPVVTVRVGELRNHHRRHRDSDRQRNADHVPERVRSGERRLPASALVAAGGIQACGRM